MLDCIKIILLSVAVLFTACSPHGVNLGVYGGSHSGVGVGMSFPLGGHVRGYPGQPQGGDGIFKQGQIVAQNEFYYRRFVGMASHGGFVVQDFYYQNKSDVTGRSLDAKLSDIYLLTVQEDVLGSLSAKVFDFDRGDWDSQLGEWLTNLQADGVLTLWHVNGQKALSIAYSRQKPEGVYLQWYDNGQLHWQGEYQRGERSGTWSQWDYSGRLVKEEKVAQ